MNIDMSGVLERKEYHIPNILIPIFTSFDGWATRFTEKLPLVILQTTIDVSIPSLRHHGGDAECKRPKFSKLHESVVLFKTIMEAKYNRRCRLI